MPSEWSVQSHRWWLIVGTILAMHGPLLLVHTAQLWKRPHYQFFPIVLAGVAYLTWRLHLRVVGGEGASRALGLPLLVGTIALQVLAVIIYSPWLGAVATLLSVAAIACVLFRQAQLRAMLPLWFLLWLLIPLPFGRDRALVADLQTVTSTLASAAVDLLGVQHLMAGNLMELPGRKLFVDEACSGVNTVFAFVALAGLYVCWAHRSWAIAIPLILSGVGWAVLLNVVRVVSIVVAFEYGEVDLSEGWPHTALSLVLLPLTLLLLLGTDSLLMLLFGPIHQSGHGKIKLPPLALHWNRLLGWKECPLNSADGPKLALASSLDDADGSGAVAARPWLPTVAALSVLLCLLQLGLLGQAAVVTAPTQLAFQSLHEGALPKELDGWSQTAFEKETRKSGDNFGEHSLIWKYALPGHGSAAVSFDYPFVDWHELTHCYLGTGWSVTRREQVYASDDLDPLVLAELEKPTGEYAILVFGIFDREGNCVAPPDSIASRFSHRLSKVFTKYRVQSETYQLQVLLEIPKPSSQNHQQELLIRFQQLKKMMLAARMEAA